MASRNGAWHTSRALTGKTTATSTVPGTESKPASTHRWATALMMLVLLGSSCGVEAPPDDLEYLVWEVCRQITTEGVTADQVSGILQDASRHGPVMDDIEAECGAEIASVFAG